MSDYFTLSLHDALPICMPHVAGEFGREDRGLGSPVETARPELERPASHRLQPLPSCVEPHHHAQHRRAAGDRKSTRLNSSHVAISYAVFCLKKKMNANT